MQNQSQFRNSFGLAYDLLAKPTSALCDVVFPPVCRLCNESVTAGSDFCRACETALVASQPMMDSACQRCGRPGSASQRGIHDVRSAELDTDSPQAGETTIAVASPHHQVCPRCRGESLEFDQVIPLWAYLGRVRDAVVAAKYVSQTPLGDALGRRLASRVAAAIVSDRPDLVTYVPAHFSRRFARGGNGIRIIATAVATGLGRPCLEVLKITRRIAKQAWLDHEQRQINVRGAFAPKKSYALTRPPGIANRHILVVDDVLTSGATGNEVARVLKAAGAEKVTWAVVARAVH